MNTGGALWRRWSVRLGAGGALFLVAWALSGFWVWRVCLNDHLDEVLLPQARGVRQLLQEVGDPAHAQALLGGLDDYFHRAVPSGGTAPALLLQRRQPGPAEGPQTAVYASTGLPRAAWDPPALGEATEVARCHTPPGTPAHCVYQGVTDLWRLTVVSPLPSLAQQAGSAALLALPGVLLTAVLAAAALAWGRRRQGDTALAWQRELANQRTGDLASWTPSPHMERTLGPMVGAFETLLQRMQRHMLREQAYAQDAAHELRTPLAVMAAQSHLLLDARSTMAKAEAASHLEQAIQRVAFLAEQMLNFARLGGKPPVALPIDVAALVRNGLAQQYMRAVARQMSLSLDAPESLLMSLDAQALTSIVGNLVDNAIRYGRDAGRIEVRLQAEGAGLVIEVLDDGPGIPEAEREAVFERFYRRDHDVSGSGLGLAIVRQTAQWLGGTVSLQAGAGGQGCHFTVQLPGRSH